MRAFRIRLLALSSVIAVASLTLGCGSTAEGPPVATAESAATKAPIATATHGPVKFLGEALAEIPLRPDQRTKIEALAKDAEARHAPVAAAHANVVNALADQIEKGAIDDAALAPKVAAATAAFDAAEGEDRKALEQLHAILDPAQRAALVDAVRARLASHAHGDGPDHPEGADPAEKGGAFAHGGRESMGMWAKDLELTDAQREKIKGLMREQWKAHEAAHGEQGKREHAMHDAHERGEKVLAAFAGESFSLDQVAPRRDHKEQAMAMNDHVIGIAKLVLPELTAEQRARAAAKIRAHASLAPPPR